MRFYGKGDAPASQRPMGRAWSFPGLAGGKVLVLVSLHHALAPGLEECAPLGRADDSTWHAVRPGDDRDTFSTWAGVWTGSREHVACRATRRGQGNF